MGLWEAVFGESDEIITDISALKSAVKKTRKDLEKAKYLPYFESKLPGVYTKFTEAEKKLGGMASVLEKLEKVHAAAKSFEKIKWALGVLKNEHALRFDSPKAAIAIGILLVEFGGICNYLPQPANGYSQALTALGENFTKIVGELVPQTRKWQKDQWDALGFSISY